MFAAVASAEQKVITALGEVGHGVPVADKVVSYIREAVSAAASADQNIITALGVAQYERCVAGKIIFNEGAAGIVPTS